MGSPNGEMKVHIAAIQYQRNSIITRPTIDTIMHCATTLFWNLTKTYLNELLHHSKRIVTAHKRREHMPLVAASWRLFLDNDCVWNANVLCFLQARDVSDSDPSKRLDSEYIGAEAEVGVEEIDTPLQQDPTPQRTVVVVYEVRSLR